MKYKPPPVKLDFEQRQRANMLIEATGMDEDIAFEVIYLQDRDREAVEDRLMEMRVYCD